MRLGIIVVSASLLIGGCSTRERASNKDGERASTSSTVDSPGPGDEYVNPDGDVVPVRTHSVIVKHRVANFEKWKTVFDADADKRKEASVTRHVVSRMLDDENVVLVRIAATDEVKLNAFMASEELKKKMQESGVEGEPEMWMVVDDKTSFPEGEFPKNTHSFIMKQEVNDFLKWMPAFDATEKARQGEGAELASWASRSVDNDNLMTVHVLSSDLAKTKAYMLGRDLKERMGEAGVKGAPEILRAVNVEVHEY